MFNLYLIRKLILKFILFFFLSSCATEPVRQIHGVPNLENKFNSILNKTSNKNDVINIFGEALIKEYPDDNIWVYAETVKTNNFFGKKKIIKNNLLVLEFNPKGILISKNILDAMSIKDLDFEKNITKSFALNENFSKKLLTSVRKRIQNKVDAQASK